MGSSVWWCWRAPAPHSPTPASTHSVAEQGILSRWSFAPLSLVTPADGYVKDAALAAAIAVVDPEEVAGALEAELAQAEEALQRCRQVPIRPCPRVVLTLLAPAPTSSLQAVLGTNKHLRHKLQSDTLISSS